MEKNIGELKKKYNTSINNVIKYFKKNSILFVSEADFQFSFGTKLREKLKNEDCEIIFEYPMEMDDKKVMTYTDIMVVEKANSKKYFIPIELKYKTDEANITAHGLKNIPLKKHGAYDCGCYLYLKDIERIEKFKSLVKKEAEEEFLIGFTIFITNDSNYYNNNNNRSVSYEKFKLNDGTYKTHEINWNNHSEEWNKFVNSKKTIDYWNEHIKNKKDIKWFEKSKEYQKVIWLDGKYPINWNDYYRKTGDSVIFKILINKIGE